MKSNLTLVFNDTAQNPPSAPAEELIFAVRTDAHHATRHIKKNLLSHLSSALGDTPELKERVKQTVHNAYRLWAHGVLGALADNLDYKAYGIGESSGKSLRIDIFDAPALSAATLERADALAGTDGPALHVSLDSMIRPARAHAAEIGFSRLFSLRGDQQFNYVARPGAKPLDEQIENVRRKLEDLQAQNGGAPAAFVLLEDNVRHAKMMNWLLGKLEEGGVFRHGRLAGIATSFCCAPGEELSLIRHGGAPVPVSAVVNYGGARADVVTPRDLFFDGLVVETQNGTARMPGVLMDVEKRFKIAPGKAEAFCEKVVQANTDFCHALENAFNLKIPLAWLAHPAVLPHAAGVTRDGAERAATPVPPPPKYGT